MKNLLIISFIFCFQFVNAQKIDLNYKNGTATISTVKKDKTLANLNFHNTKEGTGISYDFEGLGVKKARIELYRKGKSAYNFIDAASNRGPAAPLDITDEELLLLHSSMVSLEEDRWIQFVIIAIALCCFEGEMGGDSDGFYWSIGFDCDCLSGETNPDGGVSIELNGVTVDRVDEIRIYPFGIEETVMANAKLVNR